MPFTTQYKFTLKVKIIALFKYKDNIVLILESQKDWLKLILQSKATLGIKNKKLTIPVCKC
jgi:hypothetical protein